ncbi:MAG: elongation factor Ts [Crocinitomicaceae bacterium]|nr:elongation factor Ts [Crocinitomicaceae bacterium]|tara:strand:- start:2852 stop:3682 length:831 start_codon:yes stop_codon:yes gene_type:complete
MANITAAEVNSLRKKTGAGMMDCKKALVEADGDIEKAVEILRKKGQKVAAKRGDNEASEGLTVAMATEDASTGVIVTLNCETDFVAKNADFSDFAHQIAKVALDNGVKTVEELNELELDGLKVSEKITEQIGKIGEKIEVSKLGNIAAETVVAYNHPGNQIASLVGLSKTGDAVQGAGRDVAMQIAAMNPVAVNKESVPADVVEKELEIARDLIRQEGKPEEMVDKIANGKLNKFFKENTLLEQAFIKDNKKSVKQYLNDTENGLTVTEYLRFSLS